MKAMLDSMHIDSDDEIMNTDPFEHLQPLEAAKEKARHDRDCIICCCSPELLHNESIKFDLRTDPNLNEEIRKWLLHTPLFTKQAGHVKDLDKNYKSLMRMTMNFDNNSIYGRGMEIYKTIEFLAKHNNNKRVLTITGKQGSRCDLIASSAIKYVINRHFFRQGSL